MIKNTELRLRNYLQDREGRLCMVEKLEDRDPDYEEDQCFYAPAIRGGTTSLPNSPIPLTEEWLVKLGFKIFFENRACNHLKFSKKLGKYVKDSWIELHWNQRKIKKDIYVTPHINWGIGAASLFFILKDVFYVHQLQNLYFTLTGEELTVKKL